MLTEKQIQNIHKLNFETLKQIMHECAEALGMVSIKEYEQLMNVKRRTIYKKIEDKDIQFIEICEHKYPVINY